MEKHVQRYFAGMIGLFVCAALFIAPTVYAQDGAQDAPAPVAAEQNFTAEELDAFAEAYVDVEEVQARFQADHGQIDDPEEAVRVQEEFEREVAEAVEARGLGAERYDEIVRASQTDEEFAQGLLARIDEVRQQRTQG
jgi:hypothetical protein